MRKILITLGILFFHTAFAQTSKVPELSEKAKVELLSAYRDYQTQVNRVKDAQIALLQAQMNLEKVKRDLDEKGAAVNAVAMRYQVPGYQINIEKLAQEELKK